MSIRLSVLFLQPKNLENHNNLFKKIQRKKKPMESLIEMGFPSNACKRAMYFSDGNIEAAMNWLCSHMDDPDYNTGTSKLCQKCNIETFISAFEPPKKESESPTVNPPSSEQLSSLPDNFKLFTAEVLNAQVKMPNQTSKIYKDECVLTCDTVYSPKGLFVCLKTFYSYGNRFIRTL